MNQNNTKYKLVNQEPLFDNNKANIINNQNKENNFLIKNGIIIFSVSVIIVALLLLVIVFILFAQSSIILPTKNVNSKLNKLSFKGLVTKNTIESIDDYNEQEENNNQSVEIQIDQKNLMKRFYGTWNLVSSENIDQIMQKLGANWFIRKLVANIKPIIIISELLNDEYSIKTQTSFRNSEIVFKFNKTFKQVTFDDRELMSVITIENNKLIQRQRDSNNKLLSTIIREIDENDQMINYIQVDNVVSKRIFKRS